MRILRQQWRLWSAILLFLVMVPYYRAKQRWAMWRIARLYR